MAIWSAQFFTIISSYFGKEKDRHLSVSILNLILCPFMIEINIYLIIINVNTSFQKNSKAIDFLLVTL